MRWYVKETGSEDGVSQGLTRSCSPSLFPQAFLRLSP